MEEWKTIKGFEDYQISSLGRVKSLKKKKERILKAGLTFGYQHVSLLKNKQQKTKRVHKLVAIAFLNHTPCGHKLVVDHRNDVKTDNRVENLQIVSQRFNAYKAQGTYSSEYKGVSWEKNIKKWRSKIYINGKNKNLGFFNNELEASKAYQKELLTINK